MTVAELLLRVWKYQEPVLEKFPKVQMTVRIMSVPEKSTSGQSFSRKLYSRTASNRKHATTAAITTPLPRGARLRRQTVRIFPVSQNVC